MPIFSSVCLFVLLKIIPTKIRKPTSSELLYFDSVSQAKLTFYSLEKPATCDLSIVIPAYNEAKRLPLMLEETLDYLKSRQAVNPKFSYEIIVVDDGSKDATSKTAIAALKGLKNAKVMTLEKNRGKGGAVTQGILCASGKRILFADADGATQFSDVAILEAELSKIESKAGGVAVASRAHMVSSDSVAKVIFSKTFLYFSDRLFVTF